MFLIYGIIGITKESQLVNFFEEINGTIYRIEEKEERHYKNERVLYYDVYVKYKVNGMEYDGVLERIGRGRVRGDTITFYYNINNPKEIRLLKDEFSIWYGDIIAGVLFMLIGFIPSKHTHLARTRVGVFKLK